MTGCGHLGELLVSCNRNSSNGSRSTHETGSVGPVSLLAVRNDLIEIEEATAHQVRCNGTPALTHERYASIAHGCIVPSGAQDVERPAAELPARCGAVRSRGEFLEHLGYELAWLTSQP